MLAVLYILVLGASPIPSAAGPRTGAIHIVEISASDAAMRDALVNGGYDVSGVHGETVTVYATDAEVEQLRDEGYSIRELSRAGAKAYHGYDAIVETLQAAVTDYPAICRVQKIGDSVMGRGLWAVLVTKNPDAEEDEPEFKYIGSMHGDEPVGVEMSLKFLNLLVTGYGSDERITALVDTTSIWILPTMNPDGLETAERYNANGFDLNRSFPKYRDDFISPVFRGLVPTYSDYEPEVAAVMKWTIENSFVLSANLHGGDLLVNYPYDDDSLPSGADAPTPDDGLFQDISRRYSVHNSPMWNSTEFADGISNGNAWYTAKGSMIDWNYRYAACNEVTMELSKTKRPAASTLGALWNDNRESMLSYAEACHIGVRGIVTDGGVKGPMWAEVRVDGNEHRVYTDRDVGDYHRMLLPGTYTLAFGAPGYFTRTIENVEVGSGEATRVDVELNQPDVNRDGVVDAVDLQLTINTLLGTETRYACDFDGGGVSSTDLQLLINVLLGSLEIEM